MTRPAASNTPHYYRGIPTGRTSVNGEVTRGPCVGCGRPAADVIHVVPVQPGGGTLDRLGLTLEQHHERAARRRAQRAEDRECRRRSSAFRNGVPPQAG